MILRSVPTLLVALVMALAGCYTNDQIQFDGHHGGDGHHHGSDPTGPGNTAWTGNEDVAFDVIGGSPSEFRFSPDRIEVTAGQAVGITFSNEGDAAHEFSIEAIGFHLHAQSGETERGTFTAPEPGEYVIGCFIPGHYEAGMHGTLVVV